LDDPYGDRRLRGASYAEAKRAARAHLRAQARRDLAALGADMARGAWSGASWVVRSTGRGLLNLVGRLRRRRPPESRAANRILAAAEALEKAKNVEFPGPRTLGRLAWIAPPDPTPIETMTIRKTKLEIILEAEAREREGRVEQARRIEAAAARADALLRGAEQTTIRIPTRRRPK